jgi:crotonobetainyl-CoA:carnitine CoA-transferase CaiB-like acyl-CoA transferase
MNERKDTLAPYRVLDLSDENGQLAGRILADLGADTIIIEPIDGSPSRRIGPFYHDLPDPQKSLFWFSLNVNKRSTTLDISKPKGSDVLKQLIKSADCLIESYPPGYMNSLGLGYDTLRKINPGLIMTSITPFGQYGPWRDYKSSDLVQMALSGLVYLSGEPGREPLRIPVPQACLHSGSWAAAASMMALYGRSMTGQGQHVDVSMLESVTWASYCAAEWWSYARLNIKREGTWRQQGLSRMQQLFKCRDGYVLLFILGGTMATIGEWKMVEWMEQENMCPEWLKGFDWSKLDVSFVKQDFFNNLSDAISRFLLDKTKKALFDWAMKNELFLAPVDNISDLMDNPQLSSRDFWINLPHPEMNDSLTYPGPFAVLSESPIAIKRRAPLIGEHNTEIFEKELRISRKDMAALKKAGVI